MATLHHPASSAVPHQSLFLLETFISVLTKEFLCLTVVPPALRTTPSIPNNLEMRAEGNNRTPDFPSDTDVYAENSMEIVRAKCNIFNSCLLKNNKDLFICFLI